MSAGGQMSDILDELKTLDETSPSGAIELILCLCSPSPRGSRGIPALVWGSPGTGKSSFIEALARDDFPVFTLIASIHDPTDFSGFPLLDSETGRMRFAPPEWLAAFEQTGKGILFLDELSTAPPSVQAALLRVVLERHVGAQPLPPGVAIVAAANPPEHLATGWELSAPLANRFAHIRWSYPAEAYAQALAEGFPRFNLPDVSREAHSSALDPWRITLSRFLEFNGREFLCTEPDGDVFPYSFASPRTWEYATYLLATATAIGLIPQPGRNRGRGIFADRVWQLLDGTVGRAAGRAFRSFVDDLNIPDPREVLLEGGQFYPSKLREDEHWIFWSGCAAFLSSLCDKAARSGGAQPDSPLITATCRYLELCGQTARFHKEDVVVPPLRRLARNGFFTRVMDLLPEESARSAIGDQFRDALQGTQLPEILRELNELFQQR